MSNFVGGSAYSMAQQIAGGFLLVTERNFRRLATAEIHQLTFEIEKVLREIRGEQPALDDTLAVQQRNRKIQRLNSCRLMLQGYRQRMKI